MAGLTTPIGGSWAHFPAQAAARDKENIRGDGLRLGKFVEQRFGVLEVGCIKPFGKPVVDLG